MREFGQIPSSLWLRENLSFHAKALYAYLLSSPHANFLGCFLCREGYVVADTGMGKAAVRRAFEQLEQAGMARRFGQVVYLPGQVAGAVPRNESVVGARVQCWRELPEGAARARVARDMLGCYDKLSERQREELSDYCNSFTANGSSDTAASVATESAPRAPINADIKPDINADTDADIKRTDRRERRVRNTPHSPPPAAAAQPPTPLGGRRVPFSAPVFPEPAKAPAEAPLELVTAILVVTGNDPAKATGPLLRAAKKSVAAVLAVDPDLSAESLAAASEAYRRKYRDCVISPRALARNWSNVVGTAPPGLGVARPPAEKLDPYCPPPPGWREVLARLHDIDLQALEARDWADLGTDLRKGVLAELSRGAAPREEVCDGR